MYTVAERSVAVATMGWELPFVPRRWAEAGTLAPLIFTTLAAALPGPVAVTSPVKAVMPEPPVPPLIEADGDVPLYPYIRAVIVPEPPGFVKIVTSKAIQA
jgi:hypothetical protein